MTATFRVRTRFLLDFKLVLTARFRSLFDRPNAALLKLRREKAVMRHAGVPAALVKLGSGGLAKPPQQDGGHQDQPEWLIHEDWSLLQVYDCFDGCIIFCHLSIMS